MDQGYTLAVSQAGFDFGDLLIQAGIVAVAGLWVCLPFSLFGVRRRLDTINAAQREHAEALTAELRRFRTLAVARTTPSAPGAGKSATGSMRRTRMNFAIDRRTQIGEDS